MKISKPVVIGTLLLAVMATMTTGLILHAQHKPNALHVQLPESGEQYALDDHTALYASNEDLTDLLVRLDVHFKNQALKSDANSPDFKSITGMAGREAINNCVAFKYFSQQDNSPASQFTLVPERPECFSKDPGVIKQIQRLYTKYKYVYAAQTF